MEEILGLLDNREKAWLIWIAFGLILVLRSKNFPSSLVSVVKTLLSKQILIVLAAMVGYVSLEVCVFHRLGLWDFGMVKATVVWLLGQALVMVFNHNRAHKDASYFKRTVLASLKVALVLDFLVNFYVLPIFLEIALVPILFLVAAMLELSKTREEYIRVRHLMQYVMAAIGFSLLGYATARLIGDVDSFASVDTLRLFALPIVLTLLFLPFVYALAVYTAYETIFVRIKLWVADTELARYTRRRVLRACLFRLSRVNRFANEYAVRLSTVKSQSDTIKLISDFRAR
jgi:hypothetical protein